jgi:hypothetical protein
MKYGRLMLAYNQNRWLQMAIDNCANHVDKIYIVYSEFPWNKYNRISRKQFKNNTDISVIENSIYKDKIVLIKGTWTSDEDQRNAGVARAKDDNIDILLIQDTDEFFFKDDYQVLKNDIEANPKFDEYSIKWILFWKSWKYTINHRTQGILSGPTSIAMNIKYNPDVRFSTCRNVKSRNRFTVSPTLYHGAYILSDEEVYEKIHTWGHSHQINRNWYENKWKKWTIDTREIHPCWPKEWKNAIIYDGKLPETIMNNIDKF